MTKIEAETVVKVLRGLGYDVAVDVELVITDLDYRIRGRGANGARGWTAMSIELAVVYCRQGRVARLFL